MASSFNRLARKIQEINQRYSKPHIEMSRGVRIALAALRVYLFVIVGLIIYKFVTTLG